MNNWILAGGFFLNFAAIIAGIFFNQRAADSVRTDLNARIDGVNGRMDSLQTNLTAQINLLSGRIDMVIGKLLELAERHDK